MGLFHDTTAAWKSTGEDGAESVTLPEDWEASLSTAYDADMTAAGDLAASKVAELEAQLVTVQGELTATKAANWDLIKSMPVIEADSSPENSPNNIENAGDSADTVEEESDGYDSLFETK